MQQLYDKLQATSEIPIIETSDIHSKGLYTTMHGKKEIFIKQSLTIKEKVKVLLHEYSHYVHFTHFYQDESRAECEIIANGSAYLICQEFKLNIAKEVDLAKFSDDTDIVNRLSATIQSVANHIIRQLSQS